MTLDLFRPAAVFEDLPIPDATVRHLPVCPLPAPPVVLMQTLIDTTPWRSETIRLFGKTHVQPRLIAWYGDDDIEYSYSGRRMVAMPWTSLLTDIRGAVESVAGTSFNSVLVNYYRDHRDSMGMHSDDEPELGDEPVIASLSLGQRRRFVLRHRTRPDIKPVGIDLESASLLVMSGQTQRHWKHGINKLGRPCGPRVNLTFRTVMHQRRG